MRPQRRVLLEEVGGDAVVFGGSDGGGVHRGGAARRGGDVDVEFVLEDAVGVGKFGLEDVRRGFQTGECLGRGVQELKERRKDAPDTSP